MVDNTKTDVTFVLDRSGSMTSIATETIGGFNRLLADQRKTGQDVRVTLYQFDDQHDTTYTDRPIAEVEDLTTTTFRPRGFTALHDAIGRAIDRTGLRLSAIPEDQRPGKVLIVILTDGGENASKLFTGPKVAEMIKRQRETYQWDFVFLGANQDAALTAKDLNISTSMSYGATSIGTTQAFASTSHLIATRSMAPDAATANAIQYTVEDHAKQAKQGAQWSGA